MYRIVIILVLCHHAITQPVSSDREVQQTGECCPCPQANHADSVPVGSDRAASRLDHCPCWPGSPDSEGASSLFFPTAVRADRPLMRSSDAKEDAKNLLEPEVTLASSMLDTLREATEEEYRDALARDAARAADSDAVPEESARNVVIMVHPKGTESNDDFMSEQSHVESRCVHPLGSSLSKLRSTKPTILPRLATSKQPGLLHHNFLDTDSSLGASNVQESVIDVNGNTASIPHTPLSRLSTPLRDIFNNGVNDDIVKENSIFSRKVDEIKNLKFLRNIPTLKLDGLIRKPFEDNVLKNTNVQELAKDTKFDQNSPINLKSLLKLREVELIPKRNLNILLKGLNVPTDLPKSTGRNSEGRDNLIDSNACVVKQNLHEDNLDNLESQSIAHQYKIKNDEGTLSHRPHLIKSSQENEPAFESIEPEELVSSEENRLINDKNTNGGLGTTDSDTADISSNFTPVAMLPLERQDTDVTDTPFQNQESSKSLNELNNEISPELENINSRSTINEFSTIEQEESPIDGNVSEVKLSPPIRKSLSDIQKDLLDGIENLRKSSNVELLSTPKNIKINNQGTEQQDLDNDAVDQKVDANPEPSDISFGDLQDMSDKLLISNKERSDLIDDINCIDVDKNLSIENEPNNNIKLGKDETGVSNLDTKIIEETLTENIAEEETSCMDNSKQESSSEIFEKSANQGNAEMDTGASDTVMTKILDPLNTNLKLHPLVDNSNIIKPLVNGPLKFGKPLHENLRADLPTLDNLKERIANIFKPLEIKTDKNTHMLRSNSLDDSSIEPMTPAASIANPRQSLPAIKSLDDFSLDVLRNKSPFSVPIDTTKKTSRLNSYRATDSKDVELIPRNFLSSRKLANDGGILDFGSGRTSARKSFKSKPIDLLGDHLETFPSLADLSNTVRSNTKHLLNMPVHPDLNLFTENLRSANDDITENIRQNAQQTMKELQQKMKFALRKSKPKLAEPLAKPQELFDDVNDKLKAIHYDLNDRLDTFRNDILESTRLNKLENESAKSAKTKFSPRTKKPPARLQTAASSISAQRMDPRGHLDDPARVPNFWQQTLRRQTADTPPTIAAKAKLENPTLPHLQRESPFRQNPPLIPSRERLLTSLTTPRPIEMPSIRKAVNPLQDYRLKPNKVTISFGTTTHKPISTLRSRIPNTSSQSKENSSSFPINKPLKERVSDVRDKLSSTGDPQLMPSEFRSFRTQAPFLLSDEDENFDDLTFNKDIKKNSKLQSIPFRERYNLHNSFARSGQTLNDNFSREIPSKALKQPKSSENSFLSKVMNAFSPDSNENQVNVRPDMLRSESRDAKAVRDGALKENVTYRCRMVCSKE